MKSPIGDTFFMQVVGNILHTIYGIYEIK